MQLGILGVCLAILILATKIPALWWAGIFGICVLGIFLAQPVLEKNRFKHFVWLTLSLVGLRFAMHLTLNNWVFTGYLRLVKSNLVQAVLFCLVALLLVSLIAVLPALPQLFRRHTESFWLKALLVFSSLMIWERMSVVFPLTPFSLFTNSDTAVKSIALLGLEPLRIVLMLAATSTGILWWTGKRKFAPVPAVVVLALVLIVGFTATDDSAKKCADCVTQVRSIDLIQLRDGRNGGLDLKNPEEKINFVRALPPVSEVTWTIWPEGSFDDLDSSTPAFEELISALSQQKNRIHFFGGLRRRDNFSTPTTFVVNSDGLVAEQGKVHPFPVGEWSPFPQFVTDMGWVADKTKLIKAAETSAPILLKEEPQFAFVTFICSDALTESHVREEIAKARKTGKTPVVIQIFNDVWFEGTHEPIQHSEVVRMWAAHFGVYWLRAGMSGETQIISPQGLILAQTLDSSRQILSSTPAHPVNGMTEHSEQ